jgi:hypothetical protein
MTRISEAFVGLGAFARRLRHNTSGLALIEFAYALPVVTSLTVGAAELANYASAKMRIAQVALHIADNGARIGTGSLLAAKQISEVQINDLLTGAGLQGGGLKLYERGRVIISSLENDAANPGKFKIAWQRCRGSKAFNSTYGIQGDSNLSGIGPTGRQVTAPNPGGTIFVQVAFDYEPIITAAILPTTQLVEIAAMTVRDTRDYTQVYNTENVVKSKCDPALG